MERKIYERSISKHVTADGVVGDEEEETPPKDFSQNIIENVPLTDPIVGCVLERREKRFTKDPTQHDMLQLERIELTFSKAEKENAELRYQQLSLQKK